MPQSLKPNQAQCGPGGFLQTGGWGSCSRAVGSQVHRERLAALRVKTQEVRGMSLRSHPGFHLAGSWKSKHHLHWGLLLPTWASRIEQLPSFFRRGGWGASDTSGWSSPSGKQGEGWLGNWKQSRGLWEGLTCPCDLLSFWARRCKHGPGIRLGLQMSSVLCCCF